MDMRKLLTELDVAGLSQGEIAAAIGVSQGRISQVMQSPSAGFRGNATLKLVELHRLHCPQPELTQKAA